MGPRYPRQTFICVLFFACVLFARPALGQTATIAGRVTDAVSGQPIVSNGFNTVVVLALDALGQSAGSAQTDASGRYTITTLAPGSYFLFTSNSVGYANKSSDGASCVLTCPRGRPVVVAADASVEVNFALDRSAVIAGRVLDAVTRAPVALAIVRLFDTQQRLVSVAFPDGAGSYRISNSNIAASTYYAVVSPIQTYVGQAYRGVACPVTCRLADATPIRVGVSQTLGDIDFLLDRPTATIAGRMVSTSGAPVASALVTASPKAGGLAQSAVTDANGDYAVTNLFPGTYAIVGRATGFVPQIFDGIQTTLCRPDNSNCARDLATGTPVTVAAGGAATGINFRLTPGGSVTGRVTRGGVPLSFATTVTLYDASGVEVGFGSTFSNPNGSYSIGELPTGTYFAVGRSPDGVNRLHSSGTCFDDACVPAAGTPIAVTSGAITSGIDIDLPAAATRISGTVTTAAGAPIASATVSPYLGDRLVGFYTTDSAGAYTINGPTAGTYRVHVSAAGFVDEWYDNACAACGERGTSVTVAAGGAADNVNFQLDPGGKIAGTVRLTGTARADGVFVDAVRADGMVVARTGFLSIPGLPFDGAYTIDGLPPGVYYIRGASQVQFALHGSFAFGGEYAPALYGDAECASLQCPLTHATPVSVTAGATTTGIDLTMNPGGFIMGHVQAEGHTVAHGNLPPVPVFVQAYTEDGRAAGNSVAVFLAGIEGRYVISGLRPGRYYLKASGGNGYVEQIYKDLTCPACSPQRGTPVTVAAVERRDNVNFTLLPGGDIAGVVRNDADASPLANVTVTAYTEAGAASATAVTNTQGGYTISGLGGGRYFVTTTNTLGYADEVFDNVGCAGCDPLRGRAVDVTGGATTSGIDFVLARGAVLMGTVGDASGAPAGIATISIFNSAGATVSRTRAGTSGAYVVSVPAGTNFARVDARDGLGARLYDAKPCPGGTCDPTTGTPIVATAGQTIRGIDFNMPSCGVTMFTPAVLPPGAVGSAYSATLNASGSGPFTFSVAGGTLVPGLSLNASSGAITGTPAASGRYTFTAAAADSNGCGGARTYVVDVTACTPSIPTSSLGTATFDVGGRATTFSEGLDASCPASIAFNVPWLHQGRNLGPALLEIVVDANSGGRRTGTVTIGNRTLTVNQGPLVTSAPFGSVDTPADGNVVSGSIAIGGWVLDDVRAMNVSIWRSPAPGEGEAAIFIGRATIVPGARPDVEAVFPEFPYAGRAGWGYLLLTNMLPNRGNGVFTLQVIAEDAEGNRISLGHRTIVANNATATRPFGAIDTPDQGETIAGAAYVNFGWALTPQPKTIPKDGSTITVFVDSAPVGRVSYDFFRGDIAPLFLGLNNTNGAVGYRMLDTTALADGLHTIAWVVSDDAGAAEGIGSRYFTVANQGSQVSASTLAASSLRMDPARGTTKTIEVRALQPIELRLVDDAPTACRATVTGVERVGGEQRPLPIGSSLDKERGTFRWHPGPGFVGTYTLSFDVTQCDGSVSRIDVIVNVLPSEPQP